MELADITEDFLKSIDIHTILPQQEPFVMVDRLRAFALDSSTTETLIREDNLFVEKGFFSPCGIMENIAQTCAARIGLYNKYILNKSVQIGYIGAIKDYKILGKVKAGSTINTTVDILEEIFGMTLAAATVRCEGEVIATATVKLAVSNMES